MTPADFPQSNVRFGPPEGMTEDQVRSVEAYRAIVRGGNLDGSDFVVVAWQPSPEDLEQLNRGGRIYLTCIGGLPPHYLSTTFRQASNPS